MVIGCIHLNFIWSLHLFFISLVYKASSEGFGPTLHTRCINGIMNVTVRTESPFRGVVYAEGHRTDCYAMGYGLRETSLSVPFAAIDQCGIQYDSEEEQYYVLLVVRQHPMIILQQDKVYNVSCPRFSIKEKDDVDDLSSLETIQMGLFSTEGRKVHQAVFGQNYTLKVWSDSIKEDFVITSCQGFSSYNYTLELTNPNGCSRDTEILSNFKYDRKENVALAQLNSMFKFPHQEIVHLQCAAIFCQEPCFRPDCERRRDQPFTISDDDGLQRSQRLFQEKFSSTTVRVQELGNLTEIHYEISCAYHYSLLSALCILFATLFTIALCINVTFCALTGYCCCSSLENNKSTDVEYVVADAKSIDAMNSTIARQYSTTIYGQIESSQSHVFIGGSTYSPQSSSPSSDTTQPTLVRRIAPTLVLSEKADETEKTDIHCAPKSSLL